MLLKNSFGSSIAPKIINLNSLGKFAGSSLDRKKEERQEVPTSKEEETTVIEKEKKKRWRSLSSRTKSKIKKKLQAFAGIYKKLSFVTLTFVNVVDDELAVFILGKFLENIKKQDKGFEFLWVAERQTKNEVFKNNIHFHLMTNKYWNIEKARKYWRSLQEKHGIVPREETFNPTSTFDARGLVSRNVRSITAYLTKYVTKNADKFLCQPWNCSKRVSRLYTDFYTDPNYLEQIRRLEEPEKFKIKEIQHEYCKLFYYPVTKSILRFYDRLHEKNKETWNQKTTIKNNN